jgi:hypothetical protein
MPAQAQSQLREEWGPFFAKLTKPENFMLSADKARKELLAVLTRNGCRGMGNGILPRTPERQKIHFIHRPQAP